MATRTLASPPHILPLYLRAAAPLVPGASLLPFVPGRGRDVPDVELALPGVRTDAEAVAAYARVCGFSLRDHLPPTYPHVLAFPLHMAVMADGGFPFGAVGLVHVENRIVQHRRIGLGEELSVTVRPTKLEPHPRGRTFTLVSEVSAGGELVWEEISTMLRRGGSPSSGANDGSNAVDLGEREKVRSSGGGGAEGGPVELKAGGEWRLGGDLGRRYASVSGDRNPIHMHSLTAKPLGFPRAIAHGMWTKARCLAALESRLPDAFAAEVRFRKPILLPGRVEFASAERGEEIEFAVRDPKRQTSHLEGRLRPLDETTPKKRSGRKKSK
ncbi:MAG TPA: MaoC/PaaZ C-terminal domain-containing protein [Solirubrobacterales bacterium]|nr:MaoC/PaaZ C-terminal domain-containing protein [Solirubrobacterales bacterium]